ncbi:protein LKAAEAR1 [Spea bombifrons]|uniref:protein LKAAEAR1 n=1 Tax=Spea bombifrons TaxID=233779 RepID=UPI002349C7EB|nr:protein LKAAEAR1 [Spea bombifrons]
MADPKTRRTHTQAELRKLNPMQRARVLAYEQPGKEVAASVLLAKGRLREHATKSAQEAPPPRTRDPEQEKQTKVVGHLKAAEARNRIRLMRFRFQCMRAQELANMISCQPAARDAIRLEVFLSSRPEATSSQVSLGRFQRERVEDLVADDGGLLTNRIP